MPSVLVELLHDVHETIVSRPRGLLALSAGPLSAKGVGEALKAPSLRPAG